MSVPPGSTMSASVTTWTIRRGCFAASVGSGRVAWSGLDALGSRVGTVPARLGRQVDGRQAAIMWLGCIGGRCNDTLYQTAACLTALAGTGFPGRRCQAASFQTAVQACQHVPASSQGLEQLVRQRLLVSAQADSGSLLLDVIEVVQRCRGAEGHNSSRWLDQPRCAEPPSSGRTPWIGRWQRADTLQCTDMIQCTDSLQYTDMIQCTDTRQCAQSAHSQTSRLSLTAMHETAAIRLRSIYMPAGLPQICACSK